MKDTFTLTLDKKWFDMILSGEKTEEYREIKEYWHIRLNNFCPNFKFSFSRSIQLNNKFIKFKNGYSKKCRSFIIEFKYLSIRNGISKFGAPENKKVFVLSLGKITEKFNID